MFVAMSDGRKRGDFPSALQVEMRAKTEGRERDGNGKLKSRFARKFALRSSPRSYDWRSVSAALPAAGLLAGRVTAQGAWASVRLAAAGTRPGGGRGRCFAALSRSGGTTPAFQWRGVGAWSRFATMRRVGRATSPILPSSPLRRDGAARAAVGSARWEAKRRPTAAAACCRSGKRWLRPRLRRPHHPGRVAGVGTGGPGPCRRGAGKGISSQPSLTPI